MAQAKVTLNELMIAVRELTFDRFIIPAFAIKQMPGYSVSIIPIKKVKRPTSFADGGRADAEFEQGIPIEGDTVIDGGNAETIGIPDYNDETASYTGTLQGELTRINSDVQQPSEGGYIEIKKAGETDEEPIALYFSEYPTLEDLMNAFIEEEIIVAYTPYFRGQESSNTLIKVTNRNLDEDFTAFRRYFFSDEEIKEAIRWYYLRVLDIRDVVLTDEIIGKLIRPSEKHMAIWVAYHLVEKRRLYENAANAIGQSFTDGSDYAGSSDASIGVGTTTTVNIGSVFSITEDPSQGYFYEDFNRVGSDNVWGDRYSFWYKLMLYLRDLLETQFGDYSLRKDNVIPGWISLQRELDFRSYFDSYPFTLSPLSRGILSKTP